MFSRTTPDSKDPSKVKIFIKSQIHTLLVSTIATVEEQLALKAQVKILLRIIVGMIFKQKVAIEDDKSLNSMTLQTRIEAEGKTC
jgi:hypothetical protein